MTYKDYLLLAKKINKKNEQINKIILLQFINKDLSWLYANLNQTVTTNFLPLYLKTIKKIVAGYPWQYIVGYQWFLDRKFIVNNRVLIPRSETEELVKNVFVYAQNIFNNDDLTVLDLGTGSGVIAISLALKKSNWDVIASDISNNALNIAKINNDHFNLHNIKFIESDIFNNLKDYKFNIIVANPPYIDKTANNFLIDNLQYEPELALFAANKGLYFYQQIFQQCHLVLKQSFLLAFEFGFHQKAALNDLIKKYLPQCNYQFVKDINNKWRMLFIWHAL
ncbi:peptide chain release factor N(5)-glutamine methyltransferase [Spiroplasma endosymbiont of Polydrusus pterygomalis]|uniref:peptide chain release factor N(5)-glutamine methyltransferase n=1 Tax=Spiroplasma endosymbiont of Polydrusus pterygomalis TaxID=3139327 RepID=UPI003CCB654F